MIKAIETKYNGYRFRSRLEARWAVFFDALGVKYEYEPEGFELPDGTRYLPDFVIKPNWDFCPEGFYLEVKPSKPTDVEFEKAAQLCYATNRWVDFSVGLPGENPLIALRSAKLSDSVLYYMALAISDNASEIVQNLHLANRHGFWGDFWREHQSLIEKSQLPDWWRTSRSWNQNPKVITYDLDWRTCPNGHMTTGKYYVFNFCLSCGNPLDDAQLQRTNCCSECNEFFEESSPLIFSAYAAARSARFEFGEATR